MNVFYFILAFVFFLLGLFLFAFAFTFGVDLVQAIGFLGGIAAISISLAIPFHIFGKSQQR